MTLEKKIEKNKALNQIDTEPEQPTKVKLKKPQSNLAILMDKSQPSWTCTTNH